MKNKEPLINVKPPKPKWIQNILDNSDKFEEEYKRRTWRRILDIIKK